MSLSLADESKVFLIDECGELRLGQSLYAALLFDDLAANRLRLSFVVAG